MAVSFARSPLNLTPLFGEINFENQETEKVIEAIAMRTMDPLIPQ